MVGRTSLWNWGERETAIFIIALLSLFLHSKSRSLRLYTYFTIRYKKGQLTLFMILLNGGRNCENNTLHYNTSPSLLEIYRSWVHDGFGFGHVVILLIPNLIYSTLFTVMYYLLSSHDKSLFFNGIKDWVSETQTKQRW